MNDKSSVAEPKAAKAAIETTSSALRESKDAKYSIAVFNTANLVSWPILEKGLFYFFFRPRVNIEEVSSLADVQKSYLLLRPTKSDLSSAQKSLRIIQIPKKALPTTGTHERFLGFVLASEGSITDLKNDIGESRYSTVTKGERVQPAARPVAEGVYALVGDPDRRTAHFTYILTLPSHITVTFCQQRL